MLDSLVRVSRRVGGVADLLDRDKRAAAARPLVIRAREICPSGPEPGHPAGWERQAAPNFPPKAFGPVPTVPAVNRLGKCGLGRALIRAGTSLLIAPRRQSPCPEPESQSDASRTPPFTTTQFHVLLTLSSKFFSIFHHCTCLLSVSGSYLA